MACSSVADPGYKAILVKNKTGKASVILSLYHRYNPLCWCSLEPKSIEPGKQYFYRAKKAYKYELQLQNTGPEKQTEMTICPTKKWVADKLLIVEDYTDDRVSFDEQDLSEYPEQWQICIRRKNMEDETSWETARDIYGMLKLDMKVVREKTLEEQDKMIKRAYKRQMLLFHPDHNQDFADDHICKEIKDAYKILKDREERALYHDLTDYNRGWLSKSRLKAIFKPEAHGKNEKWKRIGLLFFSATCVVGGVVLTIMTGGLGLPLAIACDVAAGALIGGAVRGAFRTISKDSIENGVKVKKYAKSFLIGAVIGAVTVGLSAGIELAMPMIENAVEASFGDLIGQRAVMEAIGRAAKCTGNFVDTLLVDGKRITLKCFLKNAGNVAYGLGSGILMEILFKAVGKSDIKEIIISLLVNTSIQQSSDAITIQDAPCLHDNSSISNDDEDDSDEDSNPTRSGTRNIQNDPDSNGNTNLTTDNEDDSDEDSNPTRIDTIKIQNNPDSNGSTNVTTSGRRNSQDNSDYDWENKLTRSGRRNSQDYSDFDVENDLSRRNSKDHSDSDVESDLSRISKGWNTKDDSDSNGGSDFYRSGTRNSQDNSDSDWENDLPKKKYFLRYISTGPYLSQMIGKYKIGGVKKDFLAKGSHSVVEIPENASNIKVKFQVMRFIKTWCDVKKYDRKNKAWCKPTVPHVFEFSKPASYTFTLEGRLYYEAVMKITDEHYDDVNLM